MALTQQMHNSYDLNDPVVSLTKEIGQARTSEGPETRSSPGLLDFSSLDALRPVEACWRLVSGGG